MAKSFYEIAQELLSGSALRINSKAAPLDLIWTENDSYQTTKALATSPDLVKNCLPAQFTPGYVPSDKPYLKLVDAYRTGGDDQNQNWVQLFRVNLQGYVTAYNATSPVTPLVWPDMLKNDGMTKNDEYGTDGSVIEWRFDVIDPDNYSQPAQDGSISHPTYATAKLVKETLQRNGVMATVTRRYEKLPALVDYEFDPETRAIVTITRQIIAGTSAPSLTLGKEIDQRSLGTGYSLRTTRDIGATPPTIDPLNDLVDFEFPALLNSVGVTLLKTLQGESVVKVNPSIRAAYRKAAQGKLVVTYYDLATPATLGSPFLIKPKDLVYSGYLFALGIHNVITNDGSQNVTSGSDDPTWGVLSETYAWTASTPSKADYDTAIGTWVLIVEKVERWKYGYGRKTQISILLE
ncbi:MAG: hypothetical protein WCL08_00335 [Verrucomicrobiota bacterium]